jgi:opacity protein-like surface antigen
MKKIAAGFMAVLMCVAFAPVVQAVDGYERPERYRNGGPPPPRGAGAPPPRHAVHGQPYFFGHLGFYEPNDDFPNGLSGYDTGGSFDFGIGSRVSPVLAIEGTFGGYGADRGSNEVSVVPVTFGVRLVIPHPFIEPYIGGGIGAYIANLKEPVNGIDDSDATVGGYGSIGLDAWLNERVALNVEGKYHWAEPSFTNSAGTAFDVDVSGWTIGMGVRVSF